jgi:lipoate-protein ligase A
MTPKLHLIHLKNVPILEQLQLEEALLRTDTRSFCLINEGSSRAIVMGISGEPAALINQTSVKKENIPVIKRFSGGGTVIVDENTLFVTFIMDKGAIDVAPFPEPILRWSTNLYEKAWEIPHFHLRENDYCIGEHKCGGNAQYIKKDRWLHHTSFLWDYKEENMGHLLLPQKRPKYREDRTHKDFLTRMKQFGPVDTYIEKLKSALREEGFHLLAIDLAKDLPRDLGAFPAHRQATHLVV